MRRMFLVVSFVLLGFVLLGVSNASAQASGSIGVFSDPAGTVCRWFVHSENLFFDAYVFHLNTLGASAAEFSVLTPPCGSIFFTGVVKDPAINLMIGNIDDPGASFGYGSCLVGNIPLATLTYFSGSPVPPDCCFIIIAPHLINGGPSMVDCSATLHNIPGENGIINPNIICQCTIATRETTWGGIKALYEQP